MTTDTIQTIALISPGAMGSAVGARLGASGLVVHTSLTGRSEASRTRAAQAGMTHAEDGALARCDMILSIVPPGEAAALVERLLPHLARQEIKPLYVDANALNPTTKQALAQQLATAGVELVDGAIIGPPPTGQTRSTIFHLSGPAAPRAAMLDVPGIKAEVLDGGIGAASALKMCFGGINKGIAGLASALLLAAERHGAADALRAEMQRSMPDMFTRFGRQIPDMFPKAYRWVAEMEEIAAFLRDDDPAAAQLYTGMAGTFARIAADRAGEQADIATLERAIRPD